MKEIKYDHATEYYTMHNGRLYSVHRNMDESECFIDRETGEAYPILNVYRDDSLVFVYEVELQKGQTV